MSYPMLFFYALLLGLAWGAIEYSPSGAWEKASDPERICKEQYLCAEGGLTWHSSNNPILFNVDNACDALVDAGIRNIDFHGDSYMRQIYAAVLITLNGNYRNGSIRGEPKPAAKTQRIENKINETPNKNKFVCLKS